MAESSSYVFVDPSTKRKDQIVQEKLRFFDNVPVFSILEFNIFGNCTRRCTFCPISLDSYKKTNDALDPALFEKVCRELSAIDYSGKILFSGFSEPLLHKQITTLFRTAKQYLPRVRMEIVSNGDLFKRVDLKELYAAGLDTMSVSLYDGPEQLKELTDLVRGLGLTEQQVVLRRRYFEAGNYGMTISNRTGLIDSNQYRDENEAAIVELPLKNHCFYPFYMTMVDWDGTMILCPHDWKKASKVGNLKENNIWDLWKGRYLQFVRKKLADKDRGFKPCDTCDVRGDVIGKPNFEAWIEKGLSV